MPPKAKIAAPIDRPISRAYLREFKGWSTAFPPGLSDPSTLRKMENLLVNRDGSIRIRPGLRYLSYSVVPELDPVTDEILTPGLRGEGTPAGTHETFFLNSGAKAYLYAVREADDTVGFRVLANTGLGFVVHELTDVGIDFEIPQGYSDICFTAATKYVKFLQIDNKIFALSDAGETMRMFFVGTEKRVRRLQSIVRPEWNLTDKLGVVHPDAAWINSGAPVAVRKNLAVAPSFESGISASALAAQEGHFTKLGYTNLHARSGSWSLRIETRPTRTNYMTQPLGDVNTTGDQNWYPSTNANMSIHAASNSLEWIIATAATPGGPSGEDVKGWLAGPIFNLDTEHTYYKPVVDLIAASNVRKLGYKVVFFNSAGTQVGSTVVFYGSAPVLGRTVFSLFTKPAGAVKCRVYFSITRDNGGAATWARIKNVNVAPYGETTGFFDGNSGVNYFWEGAAHNSKSVYHPPQDLTYTMSVATSEVGNHTMSAYVRAETVARNVYFDTDYGNSVPVLDTVDSWATRVSFTASFPASSPHDVTLVFEDVPRGEYHYIDDVLIEAGNVVDDYFDGDTPPIVGFVYDWDGIPRASSSTETEYGTPGSVPTAETRAVNTLIATVDNDYTYGFFYTFSNEVGESAASQATLIKAKRSWSEWEWKPPEADGEPDMAAADVVDPKLAADQLVAYMPEEVFNAAVAQGALKWNLYMFTWSNQDPVPVSALRVGVRDLTVSDLDYDLHGWLQITPAQTDYGTDTNVLPSLANRFNYSDPSRAGQGIVAADRMVLVKDPTAQAVIRWTSNQQGHYTDFSALKGGGYKTLTSGNLMIPAAVKLWQNPQSADTLTILCMGVDGHSTGYYMAPAQVAQQSEATNIMGFEETTATPGTVSPYGCEVNNNALYHPLDDQLMKSTASNYNINHKAVTDQIANMWKNLDSKQWIVSAVHDNLLYFIVNNPAGEPLEENCLGNEIWVFDAQAENGNWSRWLIQAVSLRKVNQLDKVCMSVVRPDGIYYLDDEYAYDDYINEDDEIVKRAIPWLLETNTQGANRAHDAWAHVVQLEIAVGNFQGVMRYGCRGYDLHGRTVIKEKLLHDRMPASEDGLPFDISDQLQIKREMKEWFFYASSVLDDAGVVQPSAGQVSLVQYRYTPVSVNVGYNLGSIETFEYGRAVAESATQTTNDGVPIPLNDRGRP